MLVYLVYLPHWGETSDKGLKLAVFSTGPAIRNTGANLMTEAIATFALIFIVNSIFKAAGPNLAGGLGPYLVGALIWGLGLSLGGPRLRNRCQLILLLPRNAVLGSHVHRSI